LWSIWLQFLGITIAKFTILPIMKKIYYFSDLCKDVLQSSNKPLSADEIWEKAKELKLDEKIGTIGKTPEASIAARLYTDIKEEGDKSIFEQVSRRPAKFYLRAKSNKIEGNETYEEEHKKLKFNERDLHQLLTNYLDSAPHFKCRVKTIHHEISKRKTQGANEWLHPDLVGVYFPFDDYLNETRDLQESLNVNSVRLFAFEMKINLDFSNLRSYFFQAVSNSSWANEGYLVCLKMSTDSDFLNELQRLSNSFGIGVIKLNLQNVEDTEILFSAKFKDNLDWDTVNRLAEDNNDFKEFVVDLKNDIKVRNIRGHYDEILKEDDFKKYVTEKFPEQI